MVDIPKGLNMESSGMTTTSPQARNNKKSVLSLMGNSRISQKSSVKTKHLPICSSPYRSTTQTATVVKTALGAPASQDYRTLKNQSMQSPASNRGSFLGKQSQQLTSSCLSPSQRFKQAAAEN